MTSHFFSFQSCPDFKSIYHQLVPPSKVDEVLALDGPRNGGKPKLTAAQWFMCLTWHTLAGAGTFSHHVFQLTGIRISDVALSLRKVAYSWQMLSLLLENVLLPLADTLRHPGAFYQGLRLTAIDGTKFNLRNTAAINAVTTKARSSKSKARCAFAQMMCSVLVELGTHSPLALSLGWSGEGELTLVRDLFEKIAPQSLILADRLYGSPWLIWEMKPWLTKQESHILFRAKDSHKAKYIKRLRDGSWIVELTVKDPATKRVVGTLRLREIRARLTAGSNTTVHDYRFWTTLLDATPHPAATLVRLYAERWEEELFFRELKHNIHGMHQLLDALTVESAAYEIMSLMLGAAVLAGERIKVAEEAGVPVIRISLSQLLEQTRALYLIIEMGRGLLTSKQITGLVQRVMKSLAQTAVIKPRRNRRCQRAVRQPNKSWAKMRQPTSEPLDVKIELVESNT